MFLNRYGLVDPNLVNIVEADEHIRRLERAAAAGDPAARERYRRELIRLGPEHHADLIRAGFSGDVMAHLVREHATALRNYNAVRDADQPIDDVARQLTQARHNIRQHFQAHGDHPADHVTREEGETPRQFGDRLFSFSQANGTMRGPSSEHEHGMLTYDHDAADTAGHKRSRDAMARAWEREVPEGHTVTGDRTHGDGSIKGSYVYFKTGPRPPARVNRRR